MTTIQTLKPHVSLNVRNVAASIAFYRKLFGIERGVAQTGCERIEGGSHLFTVRALRGPEAEQHHLATERTQPVNASVDIAT